MPLKIVRLWECSREERERLLKRSELDVASVVPQVRQIVEDVRERGDEAVIRYTELFDGVRLDPSRLRVSDEEIRKAYEQVDADVVEAMKSAAKAIEKFHLKQLPREWLTQLRTGIRAGQLVRPLASVGIYAPGGLARYPSSVLMAAVPARVAGVGRVIMCTPPRRDGGVDQTMLVAADLSGVEAVFRIGGAQAIAAMAYGTQTVPKVDKVVGPGNVYVVAAKQAVASEVEIDFAAGPSEVLILADSSADADFVAADLLAQAEHDPAAAAVLVTTSESLASEVRELLERALKEAPRREIAEKSLERYGLAILVRNLDEAIEFVNAYAPEHLQLIIERPGRALNRIHNAGAIFVGPYSPVAAGDFAIGPSHILPTGGAARKRSGLSVMDFIKMPSVQVVTKKGLELIAGIVERFAEIEGLPNHARSIQVRLRRRGRW
jgi:histidinol dehydrogenase